MKSSRSPVALLRMPLYARLAVSDWPNGMVRLAPIDRLPPSPQARDAKNPSELWLEERHRVRDRQDVHRIAVAEILLDPGAGQVAAAAELHARRRDQLAPRRRDVGRVADQREVARRPLAAQREAERRRGTLEADRRRTCRCLPSSRRLPASAMLAVPICRTMKSAPTPIAEDARDHSPRTSAVIESVSPAGRRRRRTPSRNDCSRCRSRGARCRPRSSTR